MKKFDITIIGGFGHVGLPLAIMLAEKGFSVCSFDINENTYKKISQGKMPFIEYGAEKILKKTLKNKKFIPSLDPSSIYYSETVIIIIGTPVDEHLNPEFELIKKVLESYKNYFKNNQLIILRSTVYPGTTCFVEKWFKNQRIKVDIAFCPERIAEGYAIKELTELPQIIASNTEKGFIRAKKIFKRLTDDIVRLSPIEAELAKLFTNTWRYIKFATANQFFMIANDHGVDFHKIHKAMTYKYERAKDLPGPGFSAGPCLFKDAMQLAAFNNNNFYLGHAAMLVNEGLPNYIVSRLKSKFKLSEKTVGILGMTFKAEIDDIRESLSYKLKKILNFEAKKVLINDPYIGNKDNVTAEFLIKNSDIIIIATPHNIYKKLNFPSDKIVIDIWNISGKGCVI